MWRTVPAPYGPWSGERVSTGLAIGLGGAAWDWGICGHATNSMESMPSLLRSGVGAHPVFPPLERVQSERIACTAPAAYGLHRTRWDCRSLQQVVVARAVGGAIHDTTIARILAGARLHPHRRRYWKTATIDEPFVTSAANVVWRYARVEWLYARGELVLGLDEKPHRQGLVRRVPTQPMQQGHMARRECEYTRHGTVTFLVALNVDDGTRWGCCLEANDHAPVLQAVSPLVRRYPRARRRHLLLDHGSSPIAYDTHAYFARHPRLRVCYTPPHARWLTQAELLLRGVSAKYLVRFDPQSRQPFIDHLNASGHEYNQRFARPFDWSWTCRDLYAWARKKGTSICTKTYATIH